MLLVLQRLFVMDGAQIGVLSINSVPLCWTLEDEPREVKIPGETCIPPGTYRLRLRRYGRLYERYRARYSWNEPGMLELEDVPGFTDILIHSGANKEHTRGCVLLGLRAAVYGMLSESAEAYSSLYRAVAADILSGASPCIEVRGIK